MQIINFKLKIARKELLKTKIYLKNLNFFFDKFKDVVIKIVKAIALYLNLKLSILLTFIYKSFKNIDRDSWSN